MMREENNMASPGVEKARSRLVAVSVRVHSWGGEVVEPRVSDTGARRFDANAEQIVGRKRLLPLSVLRKIKASDQKVRRVIYKHTLPWGVSERVVPTAKWADFKADLAKVISEREKMVRELQDDWKEIKQSAQKRLGKLYADTDYPAPERLPELFEVEVEVLPLPDPADIRIALSAEEVAGVEKVFARRAEEAIKGAFRNTKEAIDALLERLSKADKIGARTGRALERLADTARKFNFSGDPWLQQVANDLSTLGRRIVAGEAGLDAARGDLQKVLNKIDSLM